MKTLKIMVLAGLMATATAFGGLITIDANAEDEVITEDVITEEVVDVETEDVDVEEDVVEPAVETDDEVVAEENDETPQGIIEFQTGLKIDSIKVIDSYGSWGAYYCHCDGDLYCITIDEGNVDVCVILN